MLTRRRRKVEEKKNTHTQTTTHLRMPIIFQNSKQEKPHIRMNQPSQFPETKKKLFYFRNNDRSILTQFSFRLQNLNFRVLYTDNHVHTHIYLYTSIR